MTSGKFDPKLISLPKCHRSINRQSSVKTYKKLQVNNFSFRFVVRDHPNVKQVPSKKLL